MSDAKRFRMGNITFPSRASERVAPTTARSRVLVALERMATHDWLLAVQLVVFLGLTIAGAGSARPFAIALLVADILVFGAVVGHVRSSPRISGLSSLLYRLTLIATILAVYIELRWILPVVAQHSFDEELFAIDRRLFGFEPAIAFDSLVSTRATEWFSFFYYSYFFLLALFALPIALTFEDGPALREFAFGILFLYCVGHLVYVLVPGFGPHVHVATFEHSLDGPTFWPLVRDMVASAGAGKDIFPSLHTAAPLFLTLYAFRHRKRAPFGFVWPVLGFFSSQIILATMYLRWHWLLDVIAGVALAVTASILGPRITHWETQRRDEQGLPKTFPDSPIARWLSERGKHTSRNRRWSS